MISNFGAVQVWKHCNTDERVHWGAVEHRTLRNTLEINSLDSDAKVQMGDFDSERGRLCEDLTTIQHLYEDIYIYVICEKD